MKKRQIALCLMLLILYFLSGCGLSDWDYPLPNHYAVWRINASSIHTVYIEPGDTQPSIIKGISNIPSFIKDFTYDDRYVFSRNVENLKKNNIFSEQYYILDTLEQVLYGPFDSIETFQDQIEDLGLSLPEKWFRTSPIPPIPKDETAN